MVTSPFDAWLIMMSECLPGVTISSARLAQQGWDSVTFFINDELIVRIARRPDVAARLDREARLLPVIAHRLPVAVPSFTHVCRDTAGGVRLVAYGAIGGISLSESRKRAERDGSLTQQIADVLTALHSVPVSEAAAAGAQGSGASDWRDQQSSFYEEIQQHIFPLLHAHEQHYTRALWESYLHRDANFAFAPVLIHRDLGPDHIFWEAESGRLTGVIDWGDACIGDPAIDFAGLYRELSPGFSRRVLNWYGRGVDASFWSRVRFYANIVPFYAIRFGQHERSSHHIDHGLQALREQMRAR